MEDYFPNEWQDDERMSVLMGALPAQKDSLSYQSRLNFWSSAIHKWLNTKKYLSFTLRESELAFQRGSQVPLCLQDVLSCMLKKGDLMTVEQLIEDSKNTWLEWTKKNIFIQPTLWAWKRLKQPFSYAKNDSVAYVDMSGLKEVADYFLSEYWSTVDENLTRITPMSTLHPLLSKFISKSEDYNLILEYLSVMGKVCYTVNDGQVIVKFRSPGDISILPISEIEIAEYRLTTAQKALETRIKSIIKEMERCREDAKALLRSGLKNQAFSKLKRKQILEKALENLTSTNDNLAVCIDKLRESEINRNVIGAFKCGLNALKKSVVSGGSAETIENTLDDMQEVLNECDDISGMISSTVNAIDVSEDDLEKELEILMKNTTLEPVVKDPSLPRVPKKSPNQIASSRETMDVN